MAQLDLFAASTRPKASAVPDPAAIRRRLCVVIEQLQASAEMPWTEDELKFHATVVPQMANWLPADEAEQVRRTFRDELVRLNAL